MENNLNLNFKIKKSSSYDEDLVYRSNDTKVFRPVVDLRELDTLVEDQKTLSSCSSSAITSAYELMVKIHYPNLYVELSDLFIYYNARKREGTVNQDVGIYIKTGLDILKEYGVCEESIWPFDLLKWDDEPSELAYENAKQRTIIDYKRLISIYYMTEVLNDNKPIIIGVEIFDGFLSLDDTISTVSFPGRKEKSRGGHAMCLVGYDLNKNLFLAKNSFGTDWGMNGYCWIPFDYVRQEGYDCWTFDISSQPGATNV